MFAPDWPQNIDLGKGTLGDDASRNSRFRSLSLTFRAGGGLTRRIHRKDVLFDPPTGPRGRRPTPDSAMRPRAHNCLDDRLGMVPRPERPSSPAKAGDPVSQSSSLEPRCRGVLNTPPSRGMTGVNDAAPALRQD